MESPPLETGIPDDRIQEPMVEEQMENDIPIESDIYPTETEEQVFQDGPENPFLEESEDMIS